MPREDNPKLKKILSKWDDYYWFHTEPWYGDGWEIDEVLPGEEIVYASHHRIELKFRVRCTDCIIRELRGCYSREPENQ